MRGIEKAGGLEVEMRRNDIRCRYCGFRFVPEAQIIRAGKKRRAYVECPRCGNGVDREVRRYDIKKAVAVNG